MQPVYAIASNITTSLGMSTAAVWDAVIKGETGIRLHEDAAFSASPFWASRIDEAKWKDIQHATARYNNLTAFEQLALYSALDALSRYSAAIDFGKTVLIVATTKGNIEDLERTPDDRNLLSSSAAAIAKSLGIHSTPVVVSHACVSGVTALLYGMRLLQNDRYEHAVVVGADRFTRFVLNGFQSFQAVADSPCRPFDANRKGINLGEAAATIILSKSSTDRPLARLAGGATSNDANHISGPSRTGAELALAIGRALAEADISSAAINAVSAHGTATIYNDEMEAKAFAHAGLLHAAIHSMKGYVGHTLGAAGVLESAMILESLGRQQMIPSIGYKDHGVSEPLIISTSAENAGLDYVLKTASGFGGCNAVAVWAKG